MNTEILFISDLHLDPDKPEISQNFLHFIKTRAAQARVLYILGDLFEAWLGDDDSAQGLSELFKAIQHLSTTCRIYFLHGNRDFLVGDKLLQKLGAQLMQEITIIQLGSHRVALMHGDQLCSDDTEYQKFRKQVRSKEWQQQFLAKPLAERHAIAAQLRQQSKQAMTVKTDRIMDVNAQTVADSFDQLGVDTIIHGHTHRPALHSIAAGRQRIVLGDWNPAASYLSWKDDRFSLVDPRV